MANKSNRTLSIDDDVYRNFKIETTINEVEMSETVEAFMVNYNKASKHLREERIIKQSNNG